VVAITRPAGEAGASGRRTGDRRQAILDAATALFAGRGFAGVSVQEIADAAGTHKTTVLYHFETKEALHEAVLAQALGRIAEIQRQFFAGPIVRERVAFLIDQIQAFYAEHPALARLLQRELLDPDGSDAYLRLFVDPIYVPAMETVQRAVERGLVRPIDPAFLIHDTHVTLVGYFCHRTLLERLRPGTDPYSVESLIARREYLVDWIFRLLAPEEMAGKREAKTGGRRGSKRTSSS
jgi:AcrR family transcriptional regulator